MFMKSAKFALAFAALSMTAISFSAPVAIAQDAAFEPFETAQTQGMDHRDDRRDDRQDTRQGRQDVRQDCRSDEGVAGADKRHCKQDGRQDNRNG